MIDDVTYLVENAEKDSQIIYVDSSLRNRLYYPNANEYTIEFDQPFKLVYGFDVLDAAVPVTMYNVDAYNNTLDFTVVAKNPSAIFDIDPEYYFEEVSVCTNFINMYSREGSTFIMVGEEANLSGYASSVTAPDPNYAMFYRKVFENTEIVAKTNQSPDVFFIFTFKSKKFCVPNTNVNQDLITTIQDSNFYLRWNDTTNRYDLVYFVQIIINQSVFAAIRTANAHIVSISNYSKALEIGNYDVLSIVNDLNDLLSTANIEVQPTTAVPKKQGKIKFSSPSLIILNGAKGGLIKSLGFDTSPTTVPSRNYKGWAIGNNIYNYGAIYNSATSRYDIDSPGLISLLGERFTVLRIKELEDHLYGSYSYMSMTPGIGMFKMAAAFGGVTNLRFDYTSVVRKPFHPIGKLSRLSIRFETASGRLYDFKGVNHQLMFNVKFYVPTQKIKFAGSLLNPNYDPNMMKYMANNKSIQYKEDSDDEEEFDEDQHYEMYKKELDKYDYSSSEGEKESDDSETDVDSLVHGSE